MALLTVPYTPWGRIRLPYITLRALGNTAFILSHGWALKKKEKADKNYLT